MGGVCGEGGHAWQGRMCDRRDGHCSGRYASYWNAFLFGKIIAQSQAYHWSLVPHERGHSQKVLAICCT